MTVNNSTFTRVIRVNPPGPENEYLGLNARRFHEDFRSGPGALMLRHCQSLCDAGKMTVNNPIFTRVIRVNPPGPEDEYLGLNARRFHEDFRPGPGPSMPRNFQSLRAAEKMTVNNPTFTRIMPVNTPGPEDEYLGLNARRFQEDFRSGPGALMQRNSQSLSPARHTGRDELSIRTSIHQGPRVQPNESH